MMYLKPTTQTSLQSLTTTLVAFTHFVDNNNDKLLNNKRTLSNFSMTILTPQTHTFKPHNDNTHATNAHSSFTSSLRIRRFLVRSATCWFPLTEEKSLVPLLLDVRCALKRSDALCLSFWPLPLNLNFLCFLVGCCQTSM